MREVHGDRRALPALQDAPAPSHRSSRRTEIIRATRRVVAIIVLLLLVGTTYQGVSTALERRQYPRLGGLLDVGGHQLHLYCMGNGAPTVVLEEPAGAALVAWARVQPAIARVTRVCSYDRAGLGWSERGDEPYNPLDVPIELDTLLRQANVRGPFVLVGQGLGAAFATLYAGRYADKTAALILVDPPATPPWQDSSRGAISGLTPWLARVGILRLTDTLSRRAAGLPQPAAGAMDAFLNRPDHLTSSARELSRWNDTVAAAANERLPTDLPITRIRASGTDRVAFLASDTQAAPVVDAVINTVRNLRSRPHHQ